MQGARKAVVVTGAGNGIGRAVAERLAARGDLVFAADLDAAGLERLGRVAGVTAIPLDVTRPESVEAAVGQVASSADGLDGLVNCAGVFAAGPLVEVPEADVVRAFDVNVLGTFRATKAFFPMLRQRKGRVVNIGSEMGRLAAPFNGPYCMTKFAIEAFSDSLRRELSLLDMHVALIQPGAVQTRLLDAAEPAFAPYLHGSPFSPALALIRPQMAAERKKAAAPAAVARAVEEALYSRRPKHRYRVNNDRGRALLEWLPTSWLDALLRRYLRRPAG